MSLTIYGIGIWWFIGLAFVLAEFLLPGLVSVFLGLGAFLVAALAHYGIISGAAEEMIAWFISSIFFLLTLRFVVILYYPSDTRTENVDEDDEVIGQVVILIEGISDNQKGRIRHSDSTWPVMSAGGENIDAGEEVEIVGRDNLTWIVKKYNL